MIKNLKKFKKWFYEHPLKKLDEGERSIIFNNEQIDEKDLYRFQLKQVVQIKSKFFLHWSLLAGATFTLLIPLIQNMFDDNVEVKNILLIRAGIILLIATLIFSSLRNLGYSKVMRHTLMTNLKKDSVGLFERVSTKLVLRFLEIFAVLSYIVAIILITIFIDSNLFK